MRQVSVKNNNKKCWGKEKRPKKDYAPTPTLALTKSQKMSQQTIWGLARSLIKPGWDLPKMEKGVQPCQWWSQTASAARGVQRLGPHENYQPFI